MKTYQGFIAPKPITPDQWVLGASNTSPFPVVKVDGNWTAILPTNEKQNIRSIETFNCTSFNTLNPIEILMSHNFGLHVNYSDRWVGIVAGTKAPGNDPHVVCEAIRKYGLIPESMLPFSDDIMSIDEYYSFKGLSEAQKEACYAEGRKWLETYNFQHKWVYKENQTFDEKINNMKVGLRSSPLGIAVFAWASDARDVYYKNGDENHWTSVYNIDKFLEVIDSYEPFRKLVEQNIIWCKMYSIEKKIPITEEQKVGFLAQLKKLLEWLGILQKQLDEVIKKNIMPIETSIIVTPSQKLYVLSKSLLKKRLTLDKNIPKEKGCAQALSAVLLKAGYTIPRGGISGTATMFEWLQANFDEVESGKVGTVIINVTGTGIATRRGHVGICGIWQIMSNDSDSGLWDTQWELPNWLNFYEKVGKMKTHYFRPR